MLVGVSGNNSLGGSFYVDSPVTGNWSQAIYVDLVTAVDRSYRTLAAPESRGIAGFSMGGFGALDLAMRHPDVFGSVYALSPGLFAPGGLETTSMFADEGVIAEFLALEGVPAAEQSGGSEQVHFSIAYGSAFAPDVNANPMVSYPYRSLGSPPDADIWARWEVGYGGIAEEVAEHRENLLSLRGIAVDFGTNDQYAWIPDGCLFLAGQLESHDISAQIAPYDGGHGPVGPRAEATMFPFFAEVLDVDE